MFFFGAGRRGRLSATTFIRIHPNRRCRRSDASEPPSIDHRRRHRHLPRPVGRHESAVPRREKDDPVRVVWWAPPMTLLERVALTTWVRKRAAGGCPGFMGAAAATTYVRATVGAGLDHHPSSSPVKTPPYNNPATGFYIIDAHTHTHTHILYTRYFITCVLRFFSKPPLLLRLDNDLQIFCRLGGLFFFFYSKNSGCRTNTFWTRPNPPPDDDADIVSIPLLLPSSFVFYRAALEGYTLTFAVD